MNDRKCRSSVVKQDAETGNTVAGAEFGIYNAKDDIQARWKSDCESRYSFGNAVLMKMVRQHVRLIFHLEAIISKN